MSAIYTYSEARQNFATVLDRAAQDGEVRIKRRDGSVFIIQPDPKTKSPLDVPGIPLSLSRDEILRYIHESRRFASD